MPRVVDAFRLFRQLVYLLIYKIEVYGYSASCLRVTEMFDISACPSVRRPFILKFRAARPVRRES